ncbi:MAG: molybdopterin-dependent oxidoreductase, partial [Dehalococcoidia bacterium]|nr:molybdopterin-dependent oxidoreductase [Dehalococcoidia bacterium]
GLSVEVTDGVITKVRAANFPDPIDKGACEKGLKAYQMVYHPDRLRYPLKRTGERGGGKWQRISWDEALDDIVVRLQHLATQYGSTSIAWTAPIFSNLTGGGYSRLISLTKGTEIDWWGCGDAAGPCADMATFGSPMGERYIRRIENPKFTIVWGYNPAVTVFPYIRRIARDRERGCKVVVIDPRFTETASRADEHVPIRPGTDGALALGMMHVILSRSCRMSDS